ncbi:hypothetical protein SS50377_23075 [Spironucleus salmonicida]|uniref:Uncharacterized protein n=1 Tax=Spironucleus salmonicida TaxID=348837 RepID=V6LSL6_9EUKA|nr:hypothetical protein SS50377_23075 [Spironucleus salmonicida]|eukprot:EST47652.1 Hypothetical protein SS50377_12347 [Spironucleus salmonicida]
MNQKIFLRKPPQVLGQFKRSVSQQVKNYSSNNHPVSKQCLSTIESDIEISPSQQEFVQMLNVEVKNSYQRNGLRQQDFPLELREDTPAQEKRRKFQQPRLLKLIPIVFREADTINFTCEAIEGHMSVRIDFSALPQPREISTKFVEFTRQDWLSICAIEAQQAAVAREGSPDSDRVIAMRASSPECGKNDVPALDWIADLDRVSSSGSSQQVQ